MLLDRNKYNESGYIGEELFAGPDKERMHTCMVVEQAISDGYFTPEEALAAYELDKAEYEAYVAKKSNANIFLSLTGLTSTIHVTYASPMYFDVIVKMLDSSFEEAAMKSISRRMKKVKDELNEISREMERSKAKA